VNSQARSLGAAGRSKRFRASRLDAAIAGGTPGQGQKKEEARRASPDFLSGIDPDSCALLQLHLITDLDQTA